MNLVDETNYRNKIADIHEQLNIPADYELICGMPMQLECEKLADAGMDVFGRPALLEVETLSAWKRMKAKAAAESVLLVLVSAWRSADYQKGIFERKLAKGQSTKEILKVNAAPGFSEHHTGLAIDIGTDQIEHLNEDFECTVAYNWLASNAPSFGFSLSFPRDNVSGILYEPWHWKFSLSSLLRE